MTYIWISMYHIMSRIRSVREALEKRQHEFIRVIFLLQGSTLDFKCMLHRPPAGQGCRGRARGVIVDRAGSRSRESAPPLVALPRARGPPLLSSLDVRGYS